MNLKMIDNYEKLLNDLKENDEKCPINIYCGNVNMVYEYDLSNMNNKKVSSMDLFSSDGKIDLIREEAGGTMLSVEDGSYVVIKTIDKKDNDIPAVTNFSIIFDHSAFGYFQSLVLGRKETTLFEKIVDKDCYLRGSIDEFKVMTEPKSVAIYPIVDKVKQRIR